MSDLRDEIVKELESKGFIGPQITQAFLTVSPVCAEVEKNIVAKLVLKGISSKTEVDLVTISVQVDGKTVKSVDVNVLSGESESYTVSIPEDCAKALRGKSAEVIVAVQDTFFRTLAISSEIVKFVKSIEAPVVSAHADFVKSVDLSNPAVTMVKIANVIAKSDSVVPVGIDVYIGGKIVWHESVCTLSCREVSRAVRIESASITGAVSEKIHIVLSCADVCLFDSEEIIAVSRSASAPKNPRDPTVAPIACVDGIINVPRFIDVLDVEAGSVRLCKIIINNRETITKDLVLCLTMDGSDVYSGSGNYKPGNSSIDVSVPFSSIASENTRNVELTLLVTDEYGRKISFRMSTVNVKSKYDLDLKKLHERVPKYVNPRDSAVTALVHDTDGPLAKSMSYPYLISGYQNNGENVIRQMKCVYDGMKKAGMKYISDVFCFNDVKDHYFQRVKSPGKTYSTKSGNCIELSIMFASIYECMGLEPIVIILSGHAIVGVVLATDLYESDANCSPRVMGGLKPTAAEINGSKLIFLPLEATACATPATFEQAVQLGQQAMKDSEIEDMVFIAKERQKKVFPIAGL